MIAKCTARHIRMSSRKLRDVGRLIRQRSVPQAFATLELVNRRAAGVVKKALQSAVANARQQHPHLTEPMLVVTHVIVEDGPTWHRWRSAAMGRAVGIMKRTSHITIGLDALERQTGAAPRPTASTTGTRRRRRRVAAGSKS